MDQSFLSSRAIIGAYFAQMEQPSQDNWGSLVADLFLSNQADETYALLGVPAPMREWIGGRQVKGLMQSSFNLRNKKYEATLEIRREDLMRDKTGQIMLRVQEFANRSAGHWLALLSELIASGETQRCYDGQFFFSTTHQERDSGVQSNSVTIDISAVTPDGPLAFFGTPTNPSEYEARAAIFKGMQAIWGFKDDHGEVLNERARQFLVLVPPSLYGSMNLAVEAMNKMAAQHAVEAAEASASGIPAGPAFEVVLGINSRLSWTDKIAVFRTDTPTKALIRQSEQDIRLLAKAEGSEYEFENDSWQFGIDASRNVGFGMWQRACLVQMV